MSPSTAPASTDASWSGSPTRTRRAVGPDGVDEVGHHRRRHHRRLVDDHDVVGQAVRAVVPEAAARAGPPPEQAVQRHGRAWRRAGPARPGRAASPAGLGVHGLLEAGGGLARSGRRGRSAAGAGRAPRPARRAGRRCARRSSSCPCRGRRRRRRSRCRTAAGSRGALAVVVDRRANRRSSPASRAAAVDVAAPGRRAGDRGRRRSPAPGASSGRGRDERPPGTAGAGRDPSSRDERARRRPRRATRRRRATAGRRGRRSPRARSSPSCRTVAGRRTRGPGAVPARRRRRRAARRRSASPPSSPRRRGDVDVGGGEDAGDVERPAAARWPAGRGERRPGRAAAQCRPRQPSRPRSRRSLVATTRAPDGRHANTPHGPPSTTGVSGPTMPRRNRYSTPARWTSGS